MRRNAHARARARDYTYMYKRKGRRRTRRKRERGLEGGNGCREGTWRYAIFLPTFPKEFIVASNALSYFRRIHWLRRHPNSSFSPASRIIKPIMLLRYVGRIVKDARILEREHTLNHSLREMHP